MTALLLIKLIDAAVKKINNNNYKTNKSGYIFPGQLYMEQVTKV